VPFLLLVGALLIAAAWVQVKFGLWPLSAVRKTLAAIRSGERRRLSLGFPDEVQPLAREIDGLLDARDAQVEKARARAADLAHGLKTSLQVLAGEAECLKASGTTEIANRIEDLATGMQRHIDRHLTRARLAAASHDASANVRDVVARVASVVERTPMGARLSWLTTVPADLYARIDPDDLAEALGNLIENGAQHACSKLTISGRADRDFAALTVSDDGRGIPEARREEALRRGERLDASGSGTGLGLAIVTDIADACDTTLTFDEQATGFSVTLRIPRAVPQETKTDDDGPDPKKLLRASQLKTR
jgi:signal transduction histidine kinase